VNHFLSKKTKITNELVTLKILKTLLGHIANFLTLKVKLKKLSNFAGLIVFPSLPFLFLFFLRKLILNLLFTIRIRMSDLDRIKALI
jgi:hypothetical protein